MNVYIKEIITVEQKYVDDINVLLQQLTSKPVDFSLDDLERIVNSEASRLFVIFDEGNLVGMLTLASYLSPTGPKSWVEDVVVHERYRGKSMGHRLVEYAVSEASKISGNVLMLTSKPSRIAANALYRSMGFEKKETNVYKKDFIAVKETE